jgi:neuropeptide Y receptor
MSLPLAYHARIHSPDFGNVNETNDKDGEPEDEDWSHVVFCVEDWQFGSDPGSQDPRRRIYYSIFSGFVQYLLPFTFISITYGMIYFYLARYRLVRDDNPADLEKVRRTNVMLASIALVYCLSWLPLNLFNVLADAGVPVFGSSTEAVIIGFICCHLVKILIKFKI